MIIKTRENYQIIDTLIRCCDTRMFFYVVLR